MNVIASLFMTVSLMPQFQEVILFSCTTPWGAHIVQLVSFSIFCFMFENGTKLLCWELLLSFDCSSRVLVFISNNAY